MTRRALTVVSLCVILLMVAAAFFVAPQVPNETRLPIHWNIDGEADGFASKWTALLLPPIITTPLAILFYALPNLEPRKEGLARSQPLYAASWIALLLIFAAVEATTVAIALGWDVAPIRLLMAALGAAFVLIGNSLAKSRPMSFAGIRTRWTLADEEVWIRTHRLGGKLMTGGGAAILAASFLPISSRTLLILVIGVVLAFVLVPTAYSWLVWRRGHLGSSG